MKLRIEGADAKLLQVFDMETRKGETLLRKLILLSTAIAAMGGHALAENDAQLKAKILGYWLSPRHAYLIQANGAAAFLN